MRACVRACVRASMRPCVHACVVVVVVVVVVLFVVCSWVVVVWVWVLGGEFSTRFLRADTVLFCVCLSVGRPV